LTFLLFSFPQTYVVAESHCIQSLIIPHYWAPF
jgi:hypothetical protein